jgi:hypothetical protein
MEQKVLLQRHFALAKLRADLAEKIDAIVEGVLLPCGEVEVLASFMHVMLDEPGRGRDAGIERPARVVGVAVSALAGEDAAEFVRES